MLDGESFSLEAVLQDGTCLSAHGTNAYPEGFWVFADTLTQMCEMTLCPDGSVSTGKFSFTAPENWQNKVTIAFYEDCILFCTTENDTLLCRLDCDHSDYDSEADLRIGTLETDDDTIYLSLTFGSDDVPAAAFAALAGSIAPEEGYAFTANTY